MPQVRVPLLDANLGYLFGSLTLVGTLSGVRLAEAQTFSVLHTFTGGPGGAAPSAGLTLDRAGNLYGTTSHGGDPTTDAGVVFKFSNLRGDWTLHPLHTLFGTYQFTDCLQSISRKRLIAQA